MYRSDMEERPRAADTPLVCNSVERIEHSSEASMVDDVRPAGQSEHRNSEHAESLESRIHHDKALRHVIHLSTLIEPSSETMSMNLENSMSPADSLDEPTVKAHLQEHGMHMNLAKQNSAGDFASLESNSASQNSGNRKSIGLYKPCEQ